MSAQCEECVEREDDRRTEATKPRPVKVSAKSLDRLVRFVEQHGRAPQASRHTDRHELIIGAWLSAQRTHHRRGILDAASVKALDLACPGWEKVGAAATRFDALWMTTFERVARHLHDHDELPSQSNGNPGLAAWLLNQQELHTRGELLDHRRELIDLLGDWQGARTHRYDLTRWRATLAEVVAFRERTGSLPSTRAATGTDERRLAFWLRRQRGLLRTGELLDIQVAELTATPGWEGRPSGGAGKRAHRYLETAT